MRIDDTKPWLDDATQSVISAERRPPTRDELDTTLAFLKRLVAERPQNPTFRNNYGVALMRAGFQAFRSSASCLYSDFRSRRIVQWGST